MSQPFIGQILGVGFNFAPQGWNLCDGSILQISEFEALYNLIGTTYGGNGTTTFALPDLRGRAILNQGQGNGLTARVMGQSGGNEVVTLSETQMPVHNHTLLASSKLGTTVSPGTGVALATNSSTVLPGYAAAPGNTSLAPAAIGAYPGGSAGHENRQPFTVVNYIIALYGVYPSQ